MATIKQFIDAFFETYEDMTEEEWETIKSIHGSLYKAHKSLTATKKILGRPKGSKNGDSK